MVAKNRKQTGKSPATQTDRDKSPLVSPPGKSNVRRAGREGKAFISSHSNGLSGIRHKLGLTPSALVKLGITLLLAALTGYLHWHHLSQLFENDRHFSHLSNLEKEMAFRTEMGLYYSYYKTIIEAPSFLDGLHMVMNDRLTEYPLVINTLKRFNLYPEVVLASWYRVYTGVMGYLGIPTKMCWSINRGEGLTPVDSCEGMGDPAYFYVTCVFLLNGAMMSLFFIYGAYLSGSRLGGIVTSMCFFFNHGESTRVMWTPPLRESFAYPFLVLQMLLLTYILRTRNPSRTAMVALGISNLCFMLPWQFAQFVLLTQVASLFASYILGYLGAAKMQSILVTHMITLGVCFVLMFGNSMLLTSFYASSLVSIWAIIAVRDRFAQVFKPGIIIWVMQGLAWVGSTVLLKFMLSTVLCASDDAHISGLIKSKFTSYKDFHTLMYTCAAEFDFMELETPIRYLKTLLLPINMLVVALIAGRTVQDIVRFLRDGGKTSVKPDDADEAAGSEIAAKGELVYHSLQLVAFAVLAVLIMRLKLFLTPHMCIMASLICSKQLFSWIGERFKHQVAVFAVMAIMAIQGVANLQAQWGIIGEFSNLPQEELLDWIQENTRPDAVFAGAMPTMASVKLSTGRPIVNHPHYEDAGLRERTKLVYSMYSRMSGETVKGNLMKLGVDFFVLEDSWCTRRTRPGCSMPEIWDIEDPHNVGKVPLCTHMSRSSRPHFTTVFSNDIYKVLKVPKATKDLR
ncbi:dpy-19-like 1, like isoform X4 [Epinephelus fuscoguttatus]|uniref:dpy-19-like 1, like isoform X1 n=1 Tax=Epinephelus fuscoguttatus TaxID=293821 RepID=UPI0020D1CEF7|nr:dpy-19-like 1, like isoform X1 [Epinephelus fuscoguttatus]XP_049439283.1 dpy-19-like 1, like isoform X2 [Epinephelus fuscoguttatus]XP_049439284.1 dpy-19-like 1, like isoform X3 [Epinephelus fuscoguttatus]XP_049439285.1 dpy-19-like 1, like isoform X4 [Epinephelus fuscoguttatus]